MARFNPSEIGRCARTERNSAGESNDRADRTDLRGTIGSISRKGLEFGGSE